MGLNVCFWNVNGLAKEKYEDEDFGEIINKYDIVCCTETWWGGNEEKNEYKIPKGYRKIKHNRREKNKKAKRYSGGILVLYKKNLHKFVKVKDNSKENTLWLEIDKTLLGMENNLLLGTVYISPENSSIYSSNSEMEDTFRELYNQLLTFGDYESIIIGGDFNARTGTLKDITINEKNENSFLKISNSRNDTDTKRERINQDKKINNFGYELRDICIAANLNILNGRTIGDLLGNYTYIGPRGCSTVDYVLASEDISINTNIIKHFKVNDLTRFSDHRPISVALNNKGKKVEEEDRESNRIELEKNSKVRKQTRVVSKQGFIGPI